MTEDRLALFAQRMFADRSRFKNQVGDPSRDELVQFYEQAYHGTVA